MSVLKLSKKDIIRNDDKEDKIKLKRSDISVDSAKLSAWESINQESFGILSDYNNRINKSEWLTKEDREAYRRALDSYIETSNLLRTINKTFGEGYSDEDEQKWTDSIASMNEAYDSTEKYYSQWIDEKDYKAKRDGWFQKSNLFDDGYQFGDITKTVVGSATDLFKNVGAGIIGMGEATLDALATLGPAFAQGQYYANGGGYNLHADRMFDKSIQASKEAAADFVEKDLYDEEAVAKAIIAEPVKTLTSIDAETDSVFGKKTDSLVQSAGQLGGTIGLQAVGVPWWLTTGVTSLGGESENALRQGATLDQAAMSGIISAGAEILTEKISGGISFGGKTLDDVLAKTLANNISHKAVRTLANLGIDMMGEGAEEVLSGVMSAIGQKMSYASDKEISELFSSEEAFDSFIGGAVLGLGGSVIGKGVHTAFTNADAKRNYGDQIEDLLIEAGTTEGTGKAVDKYIAKYGKKGELSGWNISHLLEITDTNKVKSAVEAQLTNLGESGDVSQLAEVIAKQAQGIELSKKEQALIDNSKFGKEVSAEVDREKIKSGESNAAWVKGIGTRRLNADVYNKSLYDYVAEAIEADDKAASELKAMDSVDTVEGKADASADNAKKSVANVTMTDGEGNKVEANVARIADVDGDDAVLELEGGETVKASDVDFANTGIGFVYSAAAQMVSGVGGFNVDAANLMVKGVNSNISENAAGLYVAGFSEAYRYGAMGYPVSALESGEATSRLSEKQRERAYNLGKIYGEGKVSEKQANIDGAKAKNDGQKTSQKGKKGRVHLDGSVVGKNLTERQRASLKALGRIAEAMGIDIHIFESPIGKDGERQGENGWYDPSTNSIGIDLYAGVKGESLMLFTAAHELTHHIREVSPAKFKIFADALLEEYAKKGVSLDKLITEKKKFLEDKGRITEDMTEEQAYDLAYEEVVADSCEAMLVDSNAIEALSRKVHEKDKGLWETIKDFIAKLIARIKEAYEGLNPDSAEANYVREMTISAEKLQKLWVDALLDASDYRSAQEQFSTDSIRGTADGAVVKSEVTDALISNAAKTSLRTEYEALPKQSMSLSTGAGSILYSIEGLTPTKVKGLTSKGINGYTGRDVRGYAMNISGFTKAQVGEVNKFMDAMAEFMEKAGVTYKFIGLQDVEKAQLHYSYNPDGSIKSIVLSAMVKNGDYPVNFDLSSICKKRVAMSALIDKLAKRGTLDNGTVKLTPANIFKINTALKDAGYETACLGCFVESKRYNSLEWATKFCTKWNAAVKKINPNATYFGYGNDTFTENDFTLEQAIKIDSAATEYIRATKTERLGNALAKYRAKEEAGLPLVEGKVMTVDGEELYTFSKAARDRIVKSDTISDELKDKYLTCDVSTLNMADVEFLLENGVLPGANLSNKQAVTELVKSGEAYQHLLRPSDLLTDRGISKLEALPNFHGVLYGHYGSGTPKLMQSYTPYNSEIALLPAQKNSDQSLAEYLYTIAGVRMQSFSDFQIQNIYDYLQMVADLAARKVPAHAYTKEISFAKLLGMTGIKVNLSVMFDIDPMVDKAHAGLTKLNPLIHRGEYAKVVLEDGQGRWVYNIGDYQTQRLFAEAFPDEAKRFLQSIGFADAVKLQSSTGYSANCGIIGVGYSDLGIFAMLDDNRIRYIIPYHASSLPSEIKVATHIDLGTDYTPYQNNMKIDGIVDRNGRKVNWTIKEAYKRLGSGQAVINELNDKVRNEGWVVTTKKAQTGHGTYGLYENLQQTNDPRQTANNFMDWCIGNSTLPLFYQFASHENYYKLLYDYNVYDCVTEEYAPQQAVTNTYPTMVDGQVQPGDVTDGGFDTEYLQATIDRQMAFMEEYGRNLDEDLERLSDNMEGGNYSLQDKPISRGKLMSDRRDSYGNELSKEQAEFFKDSKARDEEGNLLVLYHGTGAKQRITEFLTTEGWRTGLWLSTDHKTGVAFAGGRDDTRLFTKANSSTENGGRGVYELYANVKNPLIVDAQSRRYWEIPRPSVMGKGGPVSGEEINAYAHKNGYDGVIINDVIEGSNRLVTDVVVFSPNQVKYTDNLNPTEGNDIRYSDREKTSYAPTFYSHMGRVIDDIKLEKMGTSSILNHLKNRGVKDEEIKWSGIEAFLEGKKSVTKAELQEFVAGSQLQIKEQMSGDDIDLRYDGSKRAHILYDSNGNVIDTFTYNEFLDGYVADSDEEIYSNEIELREALRETYGVAAAPRWADYKLDGGSNYRELAFTMPNSTYSNNAMRAHWGQDAEGVLAHARIQDMTTSDGKRMLFIEEIQSDWHNEGAKDGYGDSKEEARIEQLKAKADEAFFALEDYSVAATGMAGEWKAIERTPRGIKLLREYREAQAAYDNAMNEFVKKVPDAPFRTTYHEYVLKRLLRMAAEEGYDSIGWTTADIQSQRWSDEYAEGYRIEYDQDIPKFLRKYGKKWGATVGKTALSNVETKETLYDVNREERFDRRVDWEIHVRKELASQGLPLSEVRAVKFVQEGDYLVAYGKDGTEYDRAKVTVAGADVWSMDIPDSMKDSVLHEGQVFYSDRVTDKKTLEFLENQEHVTVYRAMQVIDGKLYPPMNAYTKDETGKKVLMTPSEIGSWEQAVERPDLIDPKTGKFILDKGKVDGGKKGTPIPAAYNPYFHTSASPLNDQFSSAYKRSNLVVVEGEIPISELTSGYRAEFAKDSVGETKWHSGPVAGKLKGDKARRVFLSRWFKPVRIVPDSEVASIVAKTLEGENIDVPYNVVTPTLRAELEKVGVPIKYSDRNPDSYSNRSLLAGALETVAQNDIERRKLEEYKGKIALIEAEQKKLTEIRARIRELSFAKGPRDTEAIKKLQFEANQAANRINTYDRQLLNLEATAALKGVLEREKEMARKRAEKRGKEALERYRERAAKTQRELMERYQESRKRSTESRSKTAMRHKIKDVVTELNNYLLKGTKDKHVPIELQKPVAEALDAVNMDTVGAEERIAKKRAEMMSAKSPEVVERLAKEIEHIQEMGGNMEAKLSRLNAAYDSIINSDDPIVANSHDEVISNTIKRVMEFVGNTPLRDMSLSQLEAVYDMYHMVLHSIRTANKAFMAKKSEEISVIAGRVMEEIDNLGKKRPLRSKTSEAWSKFDWNNQKPVYAFERIGSDTFTEVFSNVRAGEDTWAVDMSEAKEYREEQYDKYKYDSWDFTKKYEFTSTTGKKFSLTLDQIMSLYAYSKRGDQAKDHLKYGGFVFDGLTEVKTKTKLGVTKTYQLKDATAYNLSEETLADIISKLTAEQKAFADAMQEYLSVVMGEKGNEVSLELYGIKLFKEKHYFPLKSAPQYLERAREQAQGEVRIKNKGFTKETTPKAKNPIVLTSFMDVWAGHVNEMGMYHAFTLALEDFYRVFNYKTPASETMDSEGVIPFLENAHGSAAVSYIDELLKDLNGGARSDPRETVAKALMSRFKKSAVMGSLSVVVQQPTSIIRAMALVDAKYFGIAPISRGVVRAFNRKQHEALWAEVKKYAPVAIIKEMGYFDTGMGQSSVEWLKGEKSFMDKVDDALSKAPAVADELAWISIWNAVKKETAHNNPKLKTNSEEFLKLAGERFTEVITKTQVYDSTLAKSSNMRSKSALMNMWTAFMAEPTTTINMVADAFRKGNKKHIARVLGATVGSIALNAALVSLVYAMRDDDEDETFAEKYLSRVTTEFVDGINPVTYIPFVKDMWSILQGFDVERADMALITDLFDSLQSTVKVIGKDTSDMSEEELAKHQKEVSEALWGIVDSASSLGGIPEKNIRRDINGIINLFKTLGRDMDTSYGSLMDSIGKDLKDSVPVWGWFPDESKGDKLYDAIIKGDAAYVDRLKSGYKSESSYNSAIRKALRENDPRIKEAAKAVINGKGEEYARLLEEIADEGNFQRKIITGAIAAEVEKLKDTN